MRSNVRITKEYDSLKQELKLRFDLSNEPVTARQKLHIAKQMEDETLEVFMQRVVSIARDGNEDLDTATVQQMATESFLRACQNQEAASLVMILGVSTVQQACKTMKMVISSKKAVQSTKVSFQERQFTAQEEERVSDLERKVSETSYMARSKSPKVVTIMAITKIGVLVTAI